MESWLLTRWPTLAACGLLDSMAGITYAFSLYAPAIQERFSLSQRSIDLIATAADSAGFVGVLLGMIYYYCGTRNTLLLATFITVPAWAGTWLAIVSTDWDTPYEVLLLLSFFQGFALGLMDVSAVCCVTENFPERRGQAVGVVKALVGLSAALVSSGYTGFFKPDVVSYLLFIAFETGFACLLGAALLNSPKSGEVEAAEPAMVPGSALSLYADMKLGIASGWITLLLIVLMGGSLVAPFAPWGYFPTYQAMSAYVVFIGGLFYIGSTIGVPREPLWAIEMLRETRGNEVLKAASRLDDARSAGAARQLLPPPSQPKAPALSDLLTWRSVILSLVLFIAITLPVGAGLMIINNLNSLHASRSGILGADPAGFVSLFSASNSAGRILSGIGSDIALSRYNVPRTIALALSTGAFGIAVLLLRLPPPSDSADVPLYATCLLGGVAYGAYNCLFPVALSELFAIELLPLVFPLIFGPAFGLGSLLLSTMTYGANYDKAMERHGLDPKVDVCVWSLPDCYIPSLHTAAAGCAVSVVLFLLVACGTRGPAGREQAARSLI